jgi:hypothetical protein
LNRLLTDLARVLELITIDMQDVDPATRIFACAENGAFN